MATTATEHPTTTAAAYPARRRRSPAGAFWTFWGALALMLLFGWLIWNFVRTSSFKNADERRADERGKIYNDVAAASEKALRDPASWLSKEKGTVRLPIDSAVRLTLAELKNSQPRAAYPLTQSPPVPNPPPTPGAAGAGSNPTTPAGGTPGATTPATTNANNPVLPNQNTAPALPIQPDKPNPSSGAVQGPTPGGNPPPGTVPAPTPPQNDAAASPAPTPTPAATPEVAIPASHMQPSPTPH